MARPKSEDKKQALLEAATAAFAQSGVAASTSAIARSAGVAEGTLFRYSPPRMSYSTNCTSLSNQV